MENPFQYGVLVDNEYFTDRVDELKEVQLSLNSANHLILISPRRFGKSSLVAKVVKASGRPCVSLNMQNVLSVEDFSSKILREIFRLYPMERIRHLMSHFRIIPTISTNPVTNVIDVSFQPVVNNLVLLEDAMALLEKVSIEGKKLIVVFDEFQEILNIRKGLDKQLRSIMQEQTGINYIFLGSQESMMTDIFERVKSPFYHFGMLMRLNKIPYEDFKSYIADRLKDVSEQAAQIADEILTFTSCHPYYTQQLSFAVWNNLVAGKNEDVLQLAVEDIITTHDLDYERLWLNFNKTDKYVMVSICEGNNPAQDRNQPTSTMTSALLRLSKNGYIIRSDRYEIEDPFFRKWILKNMIE